MHTATAPARAAILACLVVVSLLAACGDDGDTAGDTADTADTLPTSTTADQGSGSSLNEADRIFLQGMIPHHASAVEMAELVPDRTDRPELNDMAAEIIRTQRAEIDEMEAMLEDADAPVGDHGAEHEGMAGMGDDEPALEDLEGVEFDLAFVAAMIEHHQGAVNAAQEVLDKGEDPEVAELAESIIATQQAEITQMEEWQTQWAPDGN